MLSDCFERAVRFDGSPQNLQARSGEIPSGRGVLLFADADDRPIQLLVAANLRRTARVRLSAPQTDQPSRRARLAGLARCVYFRLACCEFQALWDCLRIARRLYPDSYRDWIALPALHLVQIDLSAPWPRFAPTSRPGFQPPSDPPSRCVFGPFPSHRACLDLIDIQTRAFDLCRKPNLIDSAQRARNCPYLQMGSCPAPCVGKLDRTEYLERLAMACGIADGSGAIVRIGLEDRMRTCARDLRFERAERIKQAITDINKIEKGDARWSGDLSAQMLLHIDRSAKIPGPDKKMKVQSFAAFVFHAGRILRLPDFTVDQVPSLLESLKPLQSRQGGSMDASAADSLARLEDPLSPGLLADLLALVSFFLFRRSAPGLWFGCNPLLPDRDKLVESLSLLG
jgi:excinuclease UvrABC nuclease subunit